ncbi:MBL fold metallo-hydrolase [Ancylobacter terrae]|uniref:MBL fold metallo-hydrolase n=1 Tax=Ancylobacter sp. sgz301288 TaxID=3342077 RepID=UPI00385B2149
MIELGSTLRVLRPHPNVYAFYDGRVPGVRAWSAAPNWLDDGAYALGCASYAIADGGEALVYDTNISLAHARHIRRTLEEDGARRFTVVLSHWHDDHVAGNEVFADGEIHALALTDSLLRAHREELENGDPPIRPLILPTHTFEGAKSFTVGRLKVEARPADIHSIDGLTLVLPDQRLLFAGDTLEEPITYVAEPGRLAVHLAELKRMAGWGMTRILPNHGSEEMINEGGYGPGLIEATILYVEKLLRLKDDPALASLDLRHFAPEVFTVPGIVYFAPYEEVHANNVKKMLGV